VGCPFHGLSRKAERVELVREVAPVRLDPSASCWAGSEMSAEHEIPTVFHLVQGVGAPQVDRRPVLGGRGRDQILCTLHRSAPCPTRLTEILTRAESQHCEFAQGVCSTNWEFATDNVEIDIAVTK
jgi:hypothetical protein